MRKLTQNGFSAVEAILLLVIVVILGGTGYYVYHAQKTANDTLNSASKVSQSSPPKTSPAQLFKFTNLGVELKLPKALNDLQYTPSDTADNNGGFLSVASMESLLKQCSGNNPADPAITPPDYSFAALTKQQGKFDQATATEETLLKQFDTFNIGISYPNGPQCVSDDQTVLDQWATAKKDATSAFLKAFQASATEIKQ